MNDDNGIYVKEVDAEAISAVTGDDSIEEVVGITREGRMVLYVPIGSQILTEKEAEATSCYVTQSIFLTQWSCIDDTWHHCYIDARGSKRCRDTGKPC